MSALIDPGEPYDWAEADRVADIIEGRICDHKESARAWDTHIEPRASGRPAAVTCVESCQTCGTEIKRQGGLDAEIVEAVTSRLTDQTNPPRCQPSAESKENGS